MAALLTTFVVRIYDIIESFVVFFSLSDKSGTDSQCTATVETLLEFRIAFAGFFSFQAPFCFHLSRFRFLKVSVTVFRLQIFEKNELGGLIFNDHNLAGAFRANFFTLTEISWTEMSFR